MKLIKVRRKTVKETRMNRAMGCLITKVTRIQKTFLGIPFKTLHEYRETYHGEVKDLEDCNLNKI